MAYGMAAALARLAGLAGRGDRGAAGRRVALVLRVDDARDLRAMIGVALFERMFDHLLLRLDSGLRVQAQPRAPGCPEIRGILAGAMPLRDAVAHLQAICAGDLDLPGLRIGARVRAVLVTDGAGGHGLADLLAFGAKVLDRADNPRMAVQIVDLPASATTLPVAKGAAADGIDLRFQPQICCDTGTVLALRLRPPLCRRDRALVAARSEGGDAMPGQIVDGVLRQALRSLRGWDRLGRRVPFLSLALPSRALAVPDLAETLLWELDRQEMTPDRLEIEMAAPPGQGSAGLAAAASLRRLHVAGCRIALGRFGTGSAGLADLRGHGISRVRVGREFVADCHRHGDQQRMLLAVLALADHLGLATLADGVATPEEGAFLAQIGFHAVQGPAVSPPLAPAEVDEILLAQARTPALPIETRRRA